MKRFWLILLVAARAALALEGPQPYTFAHPEAKETWQQGLPEAREAISPTCVAVPEAGEVYLLAELTGLGEHYEVEFFLLGALSDRAYEGVAMAWDGPATVARALRAVGLPEGKPAALQRGLPMAQGERVTVALRPAADPTAPFRPLSDFVNDQWSDPGQEVSARGFPFVGQCAADDVMPAAIAAAYTEANAILGLPFSAPKSHAYGMFRAKAGMTAGQSVVVRLKWEKLATPRVYHHSVEISAEMLKSIDGLLAQLKALAEDPRDVFLRVRFAPELPVRDCIPLARLLVALEQQGAFVIDAPEPGQIPIRALLPDAAWNVREKRVFQPWEVELAPAAGGGIQATLCQMLEDWTVDGPDPALTRQCYPGVTPQTIREVMARVDVNDGKTYAVFFYLEPGITVGQVAPFADALATPCPTQWIFCNSAGAPGGASPPNP